MSGKTRLDVLLVQKGLFPSREKARAAIMAGDVKVDGVTVTKPGQQVTAEGPEIEVRDRMPYVSRGGYKLARALESFHIDLHGRVVLDVGASTGGFTDCALQNGAAAVYALDVGYGQLAWSLRTDPRVIVLERTNIRHLERDVFTADQPDFVTIDVSFISLALVLPRVDYLLDKYEGVSLVKPQFEAGREHVGKKGVVRDPAVHLGVLHKVSGVVRECGAAVLGADHSPVKGPEGNIEYLLHFQKPGRNMDDLDGWLAQVVEAAHRVEKWPHAVRPQ